MLCRLLEAGVNIVRLNFSHGDFTIHGENIARVRTASAATGRRVAILADLPGPKMRLGEIEPGPIELISGDAFCLTRETIIGDRARVSMSFAPLPEVVKPGDRLFLNDGMVQLIVERAEGDDVHCRVAVGGMLSSRKGLNLPGIPLGISAFTKHDRACLEFALGAGVDAISQSFVEKAEDILAVRQAATSAGHNPFVIAKIERKEALENFSEILQVSDGIMIARGDLGVELPIEEMAMTQKRLLAEANRASKPVITATQMLESMITQRLPTRAEATDVANAILDGTDCVMLSGESAMGAFPVESVEMLGKIARSAETHRHDTAIPAHELPPRPLIPGVHPKAILVERALELVPCDAILVPTYSGRTAQAVSSNRPSVWILAAGAYPEVLQKLIFSSGVFPIDLAQEPENWNAYAAELSRELGLNCHRIMLLAGPSRIRPNTNQRLELIELPPST
jgi:pyruvate kinase